MYRVTHEEVTKQTDEYRKKYPPFVPYISTPLDMYKISIFYKNILTTQNGQDTDDYVIDDNNKVERYLKGTVVGAKVLILGTGSGREIIVAKEMGLNAIGTTLGSRNIHFAQTYLGLKPEEVIECLNEALPFGNCTFDVVTGFQVFEHAVSPLLFLLEQGRVLKFGGRIMLEWPPPDNYSMYDNPHHQVCFVPGQAKVLLDKAAFSRVRCFYDDGSDIPEDKFWSGYHDKMLCVEGYKDSKGVQEFVRRHWEGQP
jgi:SAM-dependent methyltransferase